MPKFSFTLIITLACASPILILLFSLYGGIFISPFSIFDTSSPDTLIFWNLRVPRSAGAFLTGGGLAISGLVFQAIFNNPLATPYTLGISSGAAFGASVYFCFGLSALWPMGNFPAALCGCALTSLPLYLIFRSSRLINTSILLLAGVILSFFFSSLVMLVQYWSNSQDALQIMRWLMGSVASATSTDVFLLTFASIITLLILNNWAPRLDLLVIGDDLAKSRGLTVNQTRMTLLFITSFLVGLIVSLFGPIGFVGIIVPHTFRLILGSSHKQILMPCFFGGGIFLLIADLLARSILYPAEIPIGIITALCGAPFFLWILLRKLKSRMF